MISDRSKCRFILQDIFLNIMEHGVVPKELQQTTKRFLFSHYLIFKAKKSTVERSGKNLKLIISFKIFLLLIFWFESLKKQSNSIFFLSFFTHPSFLYTCIRSCNVRYDFCIFAYCCCLMKRVIIFFRLDSMRLFSAEFSSRFLGKLMAGDHEN